MKEPSCIQRKAIEHLSGPAQVIAGPGSGKTYTIIKRILHLVKKQKIPPQNILVITYTKAAAIEMQERYEKENSGELVKFGTFHSICYQILIQSGRFSNYSIINDFQKRKILKIILHNQGISDRDGYDYLCEILDFFSKRKNGLIQTKKTDNKGTFNFTEKELQSIQNEYVNMLKQNFQMDYDDIICYCQKLLAEHPEVCIKYQKLFLYILVDEFQDINTPQYEILKLLAGKKQNLFVVGDDDQAIYGFRGATPGIMQKFCKDFPSAIQIFLTENYRSGARIVKLADQVICQNTIRFSKQFLPVRSNGLITLKEFPTRKDENDAIIREIKQDKNISLDDTAIILRTNMEAVQYFELLKENGIPVREKQRRKDNAFQGFIAEDIKAFLGFLYNGSRRSDFICFMNKPNHYFNRMALPYDVVNQEYMLQYYKQNTEMYKETIKLFRNLEIAAKLSPSLAISLFRNTMGYNIYLKDKAESIQQEHRWIEQLELIQKTITACNSNKDVVAYMNKKQKEQEETEQQALYSNGIHVLTMHGAKGLEFTKVYLPDVNEGVIPGRKCITKEEIEEERRLLYVAITRAKDYLSITYTKERNRKISRYLDKINLPHQ